MPAGNRGCSLPGFFGDCGRQEEAFADFGFDSRLEKMKSRIVRFERAARFRIPPGQSNQFEITGLLSPKSQLSCLFKRQIRRKPQKLGIRGRERPGEIPRPFGIRRIAFVRNGTRLGPKRPWRFGVARSGRVPTPARFRSSNSRFVRLRFALRILSSRELADPPCQ